MLDCIDQLKVVSAKLIYNFVYKISRKRVRLSSMRPLQVMNASCNECTIKGFPIKMMH